MTIDFSRPEALGFAALLGVLIALYLWERRDIRVDVPSLLLWERLPDEPVRRNRFRPDLLFALQFALLTLLVLGFARPHGRGPRSSAAGKQVFVLDISASMATREGSQTRLRNAADLVRRQLAQNEPGREVALIGAGQRPRLLAPFTPDAGTLLRHLERLSPEHAPANLDWALTLAESLADGSDEPVEIDLITDAAPGELSPRWLPRITVLPVGHAADNLGIVGIDVAQGRFDGPGAAHARVLVHNFSGRDGHGTLGLDLDGNVLQRWGFSLAPRETRTFALDGFPAAGVLRAHLAANDALAVDDDAFARVRPAQRLQLLVVTESRRLGDMLASVQRALPDLEVRVLSPAAYAAAGSPAGGVTLFHRFAPSDLPPGAVLLSAAPPAAPLCGGEEKVRPLPILDWNSRHPALRDLQVLPPILVSAPERFRVPPWAETLLRSRTEAGDVALAFAGVSAGRRVACLSFDLAERNLLGPDDAGLLVFLLDLLDWLAPADSAVLLGRSGGATTLTAAPGETFTVTDPRGSVSSFVPPASGSFETPVVGVYSLESARRSVRILANFLDPQESDIGRAARAPLGPAAPTPSSRRSAPRGGSFDRWLYLVVAAGLLVEWGVARRRPG